MNNNVVSLKALSRQHALKIVLKELPNDLRSRKILGKSQVYVET